MDEIKRNDIIRFHVPCKLEYTRLVEEVTGQIGVYFQKRMAPAFGQKLRAVMNEVFINIVKHSDTAAQNEVVRFQFEIGLDYLTISIYDYGPGFKAGRHKPPYPDSLCGKTFKLRDVIDGKVYFTVVNPMEVSFSFKEKEEANLEQLGELDALNDHGLGLSIITKLMDTVTYTYIGNGKFDWKLIKRLS